MKTNIQHSPASRVRPLTASVLAAIISLSWYTTARAQEISVETTTDNGPKIQKLVSTPARTVRQTDIVTQTDTFSNFGITADVEGSTSLGVSKAKAISGFQNPPSINEDRKGRVISTWSDTLTVNVPGQSGATGVLTARLGTSGILKVNLSPQPAQGGNQTAASARLTVDYDNVPRVQRAHSINKLGETIGFDSAPFLGQDLLLERPVTFGTAISFRITIDVVAELGGGAMSGEARAEAVATWGGIVSLTDSNGAAISNYTITSESGTDYKASLTPKNNLWAAGNDLLANEKDDAAEETNAVNAKVPQWSYGFRFSAGGTGFQSFTAAEHQNGVGHPDVDGWIPGPGVLVNTGTVPVPVSLGPPTSDPVRPGQLLMQPTATEFAVARWTAPEAGTYNIAARWVDVQLGSGNGATAHVVVNGKEIFGGQSVPNVFFGAHWNDGGEVGMAPQPVRLEAGGTVDFVVGSRGDASADLTAMNAVIRRAPFVTLTAGTLPCTFDSQSQTSSCTATEGQNVIITAGSSDTLTGVALRKDGAVEATLTAGPFEFPLNGLKPGEYHLHAEAITSDGILGASNVIILTVNDSTVAVAGSRRPALLSASGISYEAVGGVWSDANTWKRKSDGAIGTGVPGLNDVATVADGIQVTITQDVTVAKLFCAGLVRGNTESADRQLTVTSQLGIAGSMKSLIVHIPAGGLLTNVKGTALLENIKLDSSGEVRLTQSLFATNSEVTTNGKISLRTAPASGRPVILQVPRIDIKGLASAGPGVAIAGLIGLDGGTLIGNDGSTLIGNDGSTLIGNDGSTLIGNDGSTLISENGLGLIGNDGSTLIGNDGSTLIGNDGSTLIGNDGSTLGQINAAALIGNDGSTITNRVGLHANHGGAASAASVSGTSLTKGGTLAGNCNVIGSVTNDGGFVMPGSSAGSIFIAGNYTQTATGGLVLDLGGTQLGKYDKLTVTGTAALNGNLIVKTIDGYTPAQGDAISPLIYDNHSGNFATVSSNAQISFGANGAQVNVTGPNPPAPKALNIATRMKVETGDNVLIAGFIITGAQPKKVIIRGIGPSLPFAGALANPTLNLDNGAVTNDNWRTNQEQEIIATTIPPSNNLESAIVATLNPGPHTAILAGAGGATGIGVVEVYDLESGSPVQLANIASRGFVQSGDNVMIGGFIIGGTYPAKVIVRAIGPSLPFSGKLEDPTLELVDQNGGRINNDNWRATQEAEIVATTIPPTNNKEAAIVATLVPGAYTAIVRGVDDTTGIAVVEAYNLQ